MKLGLTGAAVVVFGLILSFILNHGGSLTGAIGVLAGILRSFLYGAVIAYLVTPLARAMGRRMGKPDGNSGLANVLAVIIAIVIVLLILLLIIPQLVNSIVSIANALPAELDALDAKITQLLEGNPELLETINSLSATLRDKLNGLLSGGSETTKLLGGVADISAGALSTATGLLGFWWICSSVSSLRSTSSPSGDSLRPRPR